MWGNLLLIINFNYKIHLLESDLKKILLSSFAFVYLIQFLHNWEHDTMLTYNYYDYDVDTDLGCKALFNVMAPVWFF